MPIDVLPSSEGVLGRRPDGPFDRVANDLQEFRVILNRNRTTAFDHPSGLHARVFGVRSD